MSRWQRIVSNKIRSMTTTEHGGRALDQFLPERMFAADAHRTAGATPIDATEICLEPIAARRDVPEPRLMPSSSQVQAWPMVAAAMVAIGVSLLAFVAFATFGLP